MVKCGPVLLAVDQHAADERVQLELLQQKLSQQLHLQQQPQATVNPLNGNTSSNGVLSTNLLQRQLLQPPQQLQLSMSEVQAVSSYQQQIEHWGWTLQLVDCRDSSNAAAAGSASAEAISSGVVGTAELQQVPVLAGVQLGALDLKVQAACSA